MIRLTKTDKFNKYVNLLRKFAWSFHNTTGLDWDDLFGEACLAYCESLQKYNPLRGNITTYLYYCITSHLINYIKQTAEDYEKLISIEDIDQDISFDPYYLIEKLSHEAVIIVDLVLNNPCKYSILNPVEAKKEVAKEMLKINGYNIKHVWTGIRDLKLEFSLK